MSSNPAPEKELPFTGERFTPECVREIRYEHRRNGQEPTGYDLAAGLVRYSQERWGYVDKVRGMISSNRLEREG